MRPFRVLSIGVMVLGLLIVLLGAADGLGWALGYNRGPYAMFLTVESGVLGIALVLLGALGAVCERRIDRRASASRAGVCPVCGYDLRGLGPRAACPECGE